MHKPYRRVTQQSPVYGREKDTAVCSAMGYIVDPPKSPLKRGTFTCFTLLQPNYD